MRVLSSIFILSKAVFLYINYSKTILVHLADNVMTVRCVSMCTKRRDVHRIQNHIMSVVCEIFCQGNSFIILNTRCVFLEKIMQSKGVIFRSIAKIILKKCAYLNSIYTIFTINIHLQTMVCFTYFTRALFMGVFSLKVRFTLRIRQL